MLGCVGSPSVNLSELILPSFMNSDKDLLIHERWLHSSEEVLLFPSQQPREAPLRFFLFASLFVNSIEMEPI